MNTAPWYIFYRISPHLAADVWIYFVYVLFDIQTEYVSVCDVVAWILYKQPVADLDIQLNMMFAIIVKDICKLYCHNNNNQSFSKI